MPERYLTRQTPGVVCHHDPLLELDEGYTFNGEPGDLAWKLDIGAECNRLLDYADNIEGHVMGFHSPDLSIAQLQATLRSLVERVATFEELTPAP